jgi:hypothetical protein
MFGLNNGLLKTIGIPILVGVGIAIVAPVVIPVVLPAVRSIAKEAIKGGFILAAWGKETFAEAYEQLQDIYAEAEAEHNASQAAQTADTKTAQPEAAG